MDAQMYARYRSESAVAARRFYWTFGVQSLTYLRKFDPALQYSNGST